MIVGIPKEIFPGERRVSVVPPLLPVLSRAGCQCVVESGAGAGAGFPDAAYIEGGCRVVARREEVFESADAILQVLCLGANDRTGERDLPLLRRGQALLGFLRPLGSPETVQAIARTGAVAFAVEMIPRITRTQTMDALSAMSTVCGYKAVILAAERLPRMFPLLMTAAGTVTPARLLVIGAGVAGLQAAASARRLGAVVSAYDIRPAAKEQVASVGARFVELPLEAEAAEDERGYGRSQDERFYQRQRELLGRVVAESDVVITTAVVPGRKAPVLVTAEMVRKMKPGSVIVDLAAERGGNCELTRMEETAVVEPDVTIVGTINLASTVPHHASQLYGKALTAFFLHLVQDGAVRLDGDEIVRDTLLSRDGEIVHPRVREALQAAPPPTNAGPPP